MNCTRFASEFNRMRRVKRFKIDWQRITRWFEQLSMGVRQASPGDLSLDSSFKIKPPSVKIIKSRAGSFPLWNAAFRRLIYIEPISNFYWRNL